MDAELSKSPDPLTLPPAGMAVRDAYARCLAIARSHYENFPVASLMLPKKVRTPIAVIYAFARTADDFADEGNLTPDERLALLAAYRQQLETIDSDATQTEPVFIALADVIARYRLPIQLFHDLLTAFTWDVTKKRYADFADVLHYCQHSANPIGRLLLYIYAKATPLNLAHADAICSALQLINFLQDLTQDYEENGRIYLPLDEMRAYGVSEEHIKNKINDSAMRGLLTLQIERIRQMMHNGAPLGRVLPGRLGFELRLTIQGGLQILQALEQTDDVFSRPRLDKRARLRLLWRAMWQ